MNHDFYGLLLYVGAAVIVETEPVPVEPEAGGSTKPPRLRVRRLEDLRDLASLLRKSLKVPFLAM